MLYLMNGDDESSLTIEANTNAGEFHKLYQYTPTSNIQNGDVKYVIEKINSEFMKDLVNCLIKKETKQFFVGPFFPSWYDRLKHAFVSIVKHQCGDDEPFCRLTMSFRYQEAMVLGFILGDKYVIFHMGKAKVGRVIIAPYPSWGDGETDYLLCYYDKIVRSRFGGHLLPILDACILESSGGKGFTRKVYKNLTLIRWILSVSSTPISMVDLFILIKMSYIGFYPYQTHR